MCGIQTSFADHRRLADLPYFELDGDGRIRLADDSLGPIADCHTHLALTYGRRRSVDLRARHERVQHYLPLERPLDLDVYINRNFTEGDLEKMRKDLTLGGITKSGMRTTHTAGNLSDEMANLGVRRSVLLPIDYPALSWNAETYLEIARDIEGLVSLGSVHPYAKNPGDKLAVQKDLGARGIKCHPAVQMTAPDNRRAMELYGLCGELDMLVFWHCGPVGIEPRLGRYFSQLKHYWPAVAENPDTTFVLGHAGALQMEQALELCKAYDNVYLELASQSVSNFRRILKEAPPERYVLGSDWPFYHQATALAKGLIATEGEPEVRKRLLWENAERLFRFN